MSWGEREPESGDQNYKSRYEDSEAVRNVLGQRTTPEIPPPPKSERCFAGPAPQASAGLLIEHDLAESDLLRRHFDALVVRDELEGLLE